MRIIAGRWGGRRLRPLAGRDVRPTSDRVREAWMSALGGDLEGLSVLDLFAGSGALGLEALSRGATGVVLVERSPKALAVLEGNVRLLGAESECRAVRAEALRFARGLDRFAFDLALADPPYDKGLAREILDLFDRHPFAKELWVEHRTGEDVGDRAGLRQRRYGDTTLSTLRAGA